MRKPKNHAMKELSDGQIEKIISLGKRQVATCLQAIFDTIRKNLFRR